MKTYIVGIGGGSCSGKTTLAHQISEGLDAQVIRMDNYFKAHPELSKEERYQLNMDHPDSYDWELFKDHLSKLRSGKSIDIPIYDFKIHDRTDKTLHLESRNRIIIEGLHVFWNDEINKLYNLKIYVNAEERIRINRRLLRDTQKWGDKPQMVLDRFNRTVKPMHDQYVEPSRNRATFKLNGNKPISKRYINLFRWMIQEGTQS